MFTRLKFPDPLDGSGGGALGKGGDGMQRERRWERLSEESGKG